MQFVNFWGSSTFLKTDITYFFDEIGDYKISDKNDIDYASDVNQTAFENDIKPKEIEILTSSYKKISNSEVRKNILALLKSLSS